MVGDGRRHGCTIPVSAAAVNPRELAQRYRQAMASRPSLISELPAGGAVERQLRQALSVLSPGALAREPEKVRRVIDRAGPGNEPLIVVVEAAEELREEELGPVLAAARRSRRPVILRIAGDG
jgi:hypothetical protein